MLIVVFFPLTSLSSANRTMSSMIMHLNFTSHKIYVKITYTYATLRTGSFSWRLRSRNVPIRSSIEEKGDDNIVDALSFEVVSEKLKASSNSFLSMNDLEIWNGTSISIDLKKNTLVRKAMKGEIYDVGGMDIRNEDMEEQRSVGVVDRQIHWFRNPQIYMVHPIDTWNAYVLRIRSIKRLRERFFLANISRSVDMTIERKKTVICICDQRTTSKTWKINWVSMNENTQSSGSKNDKGASTVQM